MKSITTDRNSATHYTWGSNCDSWMLLETEGLSVREEHMPPGTREKKHFHSHAQQFFYILRGQATFMIDTDVNINLSANQGIHISPGTKHFIENTSDQALDFLVISQPTTNNDRTNLEE